MGQRSPNFCSERRRRRVLDAQTIQKASLEQQWTLNWLSHEVGSPAPAADLCRPEGTSLITLTTRCGAGACFGDRTLGCIFYDFRKIFFQRKTGRSDSEGRKGWSPPGADQNPIWEKIELLRARISKPTTELLFKSHSLMKHYPNPRLRENESFLKNSLGEKRRARFRSG